MLTIHTCTSSAASSACHTCQQSLHLCQFTHLRPPSCQLGSPTCPLPSGVFHGVLSAPPSLLASLPATTPTFSHPYGQFSQASSPPQSSVPLGSLASAPPAPWSSVPVFPGVQPGIKL
ncbi:splicing factor, proline- and glutamine-rich-like [Micropterus dolomieu]|uniref:splicing factor, proline- and glutamine-rich-like n=1 Tax=Micropterus dolomieu TaxID=147949 RepID=UPI001E8E1509|nr:splicing factor, proline- and glutamine-rich-like [Micropterus dolomieu]